MNQFFKILCLLSIAPSLYGQFDRGTIDFGMGAVISVGLQEEIGFDARIQFTTLTEKYRYLIAYNRYFISETQNREILSELDASFMIKAITYLGIKLDAGVGYIINDYRLLKNARDTSNLFITSGRYNHGLQLKMRGAYQLFLPVDVFLELNLKSYGRRYDTIVFGVTYSIGI